MASGSSRTLLLDASVLVAIHSTEPRSSIVRERVQREPFQYTTPFCYYEAMNVLKAKWKFKGQIDFAEYRDACTALTSWFGGISRQGWVQDQSFLAPSTLLEVRDLIARTALDFSDAFQLYSAKFGHFSVLTGDSAPVLATTDAELAKTARLEGIRAWRVDAEVEPE